jgi:hypothetical protein
MEFRQQEPAVTIHLATLNSLKLERKDVSYFIKRREADLHGYTVEEATKNGGIVPGLFVLNPMSTKLFSRKDLIARKVLTLGVVGKTGNLAVWTDGDKQFLASVLNEGTYTTLHIRGEIKRHSIQLSLAQEHFQRQYGK